jgi:uncharacterized cysteine cluster protein YcgN (CxxCxxCC family)
MNSLICSKVDKCPIYNNKLLRNKETEEAYKNIYCKNGKENFTLCKRYQVSERIGKCADFVMPNSFLSVDELIDRICKIEEPEMPK